MHKQKWLVLLVLLNISCEVTALKFNQPEINDGFANRTIWSIAQDQTKVMWFATTQNVLMFDGYEFYPLDIPESIRYKKRTLHVDHTNRLWIGTEFGEVFSYQDGVAVSHGLIGSRVVSNQVDASWQINQISSDEGHIYFATQQGLYLKSKETEGFVLISDDSSMVKSIWVNEDKSIYLTNHHDVKVYQPQTQQLTSVFSFGSDEKPRVIHVSDEGVLFVGTNQNLYQFDNNHKNPHVMKQIPKDVILSLDSDEERLWVGTLTQGLFMVDRVTSQVANHRHQPKVIGSLSDDVIVTMYLEAGGALFLGTFDGNINSTHTQQIHFGALSGGLYEVACLKSNVIYHVYQDSDVSLWLSTANGVVHHNKSSGSCEYYGSDENPNSLSYPEIRSVNKALGPGYWVATNKGLNLLLADENKVDRLIDKVPQLPTIFSLNRSKDEVLIATEAGLYTYFITSQSYTQFQSSDSVYEQVAFFAHSQSKTKVDYFATDLGLVKLHKQMIQPVSQINEQLQGAKIGDIHINPADDSFWLSTTEAGLFHFTASGKLLKQWSPGFELPKNAQLLDILQDNFGDLWISSRNGLFRLKANTHDIHVFYTENGLQGNAFKRGSSFKASDNKLYFGGLNGLNGFYPQNIDVDATAPEVILTQFSRFNRVLKMGEQVGGFTLHQPINQISELVLSHKDYVFGFEFAALDYSAPLRTQYAYKMEGLDPDWNVRDASNRQVTYTNLNPGTYTFTMKAASQPGVWSHPPKSILLRVKPAPWFSWWAYILYVALLMLVLIGLINRKVKQERRMSKQLKVQVNQQTQQIKQQNKTLKMLMVRKNELFSNVSHEFRTPLTLILGPIENMINQPDCSHHLTALQMVKRNASRLLKLVDQLMLLAKHSEHVALPRKPQEVKTTILSVISSFEHAALEKGIHLSAVDVVTGYVNVTQDALEIIIGNLLSNAIKYTGLGGQVEVTVVTKGGYLWIEVRDNGPGIPLHEQVSVFERFRRLDENQTIDGVGIGLALVQEVANMNGTQILLESHEGKGSAFRFKLPLVEQQETDELVLNSATDSITENIPSYALAGLPIKQSKHLPSLLIIEDNKDMQAHLLNELSVVFNCEVADHGKVGLAMAIQSIPDIILCDVMMPKMDGFEVCRLLRNSPLTSHIPLILLTALNERASRIKGWRDGVDMFLTKPFDAQELRMQLNNIINIRRILSQKVKYQVLNQSTTINLPQVDAKFVQKLQQCVADNYQDPTLNLSKMAKIMFVSERQLQRKSKALMSEAPIDFLREWRLKIASKKLLEGHQVSLISEQCGFNSVSYFSSAFKSKFGLPPKQYQTANKRTES